MYMYVCIMYVGVPDASDKLIMALGLGGSDQDYSSVQNLIPQRPAPRQPTNNYHFRISTFSNIYTVPRPQHCPRSGRDPQVCHHLTGEQTH